MSNAAIDWVRDHGGRRCGSNADVAVLMLLADRANDHGITWVTHDALVESLPTSRRQTVSEACKRLVDAKVVDAFTVNHGARTRQLLRVGAGALGTVPTSVSLPEWCRWTDLPTGWTSSTVERDRDAQESSTVESAGASTVEREDTDERGQVLQHAQAYTSSTVERETPARLSVPNPKENPQGTLNNMADGKVTRTFKVEGVDDPMPTATTGMPLTGVLLDWSIKAGFTERGARSALDEARECIETIKLTQGTGREARATSIAVCIDYLEALAEDRASDDDDARRARGMIASRVHNAGPSVVLDALAESLDRGAGLSGEHKGLAAVVQYALAVQKGDAA